jgi:hypothetical protein
MVMAMDSGGKVQRSERAPSDASVASHAGVGAGAMG